MTTVTVTPAQARLLAERVQAWRAAQQEAETLLAILTLGHDVTGSLADVNVETGVLTFQASDPDPEPEPAAVALAA